jgi:hypothetical protein
MQPQPSESFASQIEQAHRLYCTLTGQTLPLRYDRERQWYELLRAGHTPAQVRAVIEYLQREIRAGRRNVGALKLSNLLQPDRFEEDLQISRVRLSASRSANARSPIRADTADSRRIEPPAEPCPREQVGEWLRQTKVRLFGTQPDS